MTEHAPLDPQVVKAADEPLRREILTILDTTAATPQELAEALDESLATICRHVAVLRDLGLLEAPGRRRGGDALQTRYQSASPSSGSDPRASGKQPGLRELAELLVRVLGDGEDAAGGDALAAAQLSELDAEGEVAATACLRALRTQLREIAAESARRAARG
ncbi:MAG TPA: helix-turn-helix domain-containing protein [Solirubrobacteraceae bacterium]|nr:helix-turn-helix domain-containing protein [Solirubrobacteraceae bacterium]